MHAAFAVFAASSAACFRAVAFAAFAAFATFAAALAAAAFAVSFAFVGIYVAASIAGAGTGLSEVVLTGFVGLLVVACAVVMGSLGWSRFAAMVMETPAAKSLAHLGGDGISSSSLQPANAPEPAAESLARSDVDTSGGSFSLQPVSAPKAAAKPPTRSSEDGSCLLSCSGSTDAHVQLASDDDASSTRSAYQTKIDQRLCELASLPRSTHRDALVIKERLRQRIEQELMSQAYDDDMEIKYGPPDDTLPGNASADGDSLDAASPDVTRSMSVCEKLACDKDMEINGSANSIGSLQHSAIDSSDGMPDPPGTPVKALLVAVGQPHGESGGKGDVGLTQLVAADGGDSVPVPLDTPAKAPPVAVQQPRDKSGGNGNVGSPPLSAANGGNSVPGPLGTPVKTAQMAFGQPRGVSGGNGCIGSLQIAARACRGAHSACRASQSFRLTAAASRRSRSPRTRSRASRFFPLAMSGAPGSSHWGSPSLFLQEVSAVTSQLYVPGPNR